MRLHLCLLALAYLLFAEVAYGSLVGDTVTARWQYPPTGFDQTSTYVVGSGPEGIWPPTAIATTIDFGAASISVDYGPGVLGQGAETVWTFSSLDATPASQITNVTVSTNWTNWDDSFISFGDDFIQINFLSQVSFDAASDSWLATIAFTRVPEPTSLAIVGLSMLYCVQTRRRR